MGQERKPVATPETLGALGQIVRTFRLVWHLMQDPRVPILPKLIIPAAILYVVSPIDLIPDFILGLGQVDDLAIFVLSIRFFIAMCPPDIVEEHRRALDGTQTRSGDAEENTVEGTYRVMSDDE